MKEKDSNPPLDIDYVDQWNNKEIAEYKQQLGIYTAQSLAQAGLCAPTPWYKDMLPGLLPISDNDLKEIGLTTVKIGNQRVIGLQEPVESSDESHIDPVANSLLIIHSITHGNVGANKLRKLLPALYPTSNRIQSEDEKGVQLILEHPYILGPLNNDLDTMWHWLDLNKAQQLQYPERYIQEVQSKITVLPEYLNYLIEGMDKNDLFRKVRKAMLDLTQIFVQAPESTLSGFYSYTAFRNAQGASFTKESAASPALPTTSHAKSIPAGKILYSISSETRGPAQTPPKQKEIPTTSEFDTARAAFLSCVENIINLHNPTEAEIDHWTVALQQFIYINLGLDREKVTSFISSFRLMQPDEMRANVNDLFIGKELDYNRAYLRATFLQGLDEETMYEMLEEGMIPDDLINVYDALAQGNR